MFTNYKKIAGVLAGLILLPLNVYSGQLQELNFSELPGDRVEIRLQFDEAPDAPKGYTIEEPARIVLDFADVENAVSQKKFNMDIGQVNSAVVVAGGNRTRMIINMDALAPYVTRTEGTELVIEVGNVSAGASQVASSASSSSPTQSKRFDSVASSIENVDFRRGEDGEGKVIISLSNPSVSVDVEEVAGGIEIGFLQTELPPKLRRKLDVGDFATPVKLISAQSGRLRSTIEISATGEYDYLAYQADNEYVVSIKPLTRVEIEEKKSKFAYTGEKLSLNFQNIEVRSVLQLIADFTDLNLVASDTVTGNITLRLDNVPWDQALDLVLKTKGLDKRQIGNVLLVAPAVEIAERERQELETKKQLEELAPLRTEYIRVRYADAAEIFALFIPQQQNGAGGASGGGLTGGIGGATGGEEQNQSSVLSERGRAIVDERTNSIILTDTEEKISEFRKIIDQIDIPIRQVMIEARIVIANTDFRKELGSRISGAATGDSDDGSVLNGIRGAIGGGTGAAGVARTPSGLGVNLPVATNPAGSFALDIIGSDVFLGLEISALEETGYGEIVSQPRVITGDNEQASIESGTEIAFLESAASGAATVSFREAVLSLDVTPQITPDDNIIMDLQINQDSVGQLFAGENGAQIPTIDVTELSTQVLVADGQTVVLGGIFQNERNQVTTKVPLLGDIPYLGRLFKREVNEDDKMELIFFITPRIVSSTLTN